MTSLPRLSIDIDKIGTKCDTLGIYSAESEGKMRILYCLEGDDVLIINRSGFLKLNMEEVPNMIEELEELIKEYKAISRCGRFIKRRETRGRIPNEVKESVICDIKKGHSSLVISDKYGISYETVRRWKEELRKA